MTVIRTLSFFLVLSLAAPAHADDWWGRDKSLHFGISVALGAGGEGAAVCDYRDRVMGWAVSGYRFG